MARPKFESVLAVDNTVNHLLDMSSSLVNGNVLIVDEDGAVVDKPVRAVGLYDRVLPLETGTRASDILKMASDEYVQTIFLSLSRGVWDEARKVPEGRSTACLEAKQQANAFAFLASSPRNATSAFAANSRKGPGGDLGALLGSDNKNLSELSADLSEYRCFVATLA